MWFEAEPRFVWITLLTTPGDAPQALAIQGFRWNDRKTNKEKMLNGINNLQSLLVL
jgi:hypothetical protein